MRLIGAKEFLKTVKAGTLCVEFWLEDEEECLNLIKDYKEKGAEYILREYCSEYYIFGNNLGSLAFSFNRHYPNYEVIDGVKYDCLCYYDKNIVGDADPSATLQLVFENEDEYPEGILVSETRQILDKNDIKRIQKWFLNNANLDSEIAKDSYSWALKTLEDSEYYKDSVIVNYKGDCVI